MSFEQANQREIPSLTDYAVKTKAGVVDLMVESAGPPEATRLGGGDVLHLAIPLGTQNALECLITEGGNVAAAFAAVTSNVTRVTESVGMQQVESGVWNDHPYLLIEQIYTKGGRVGLLKTIVTVKDMRTVLCFHDESGYKQTIRRIVGKLVASLKSEFPAALRREVHALRVADKPAGFAQVVYWPAENGGIVAHTLSVSAIPRSPNDLVMHQSGRLEVSNPEGEVSRIVEEEVSGGEIDYVLVLERTNDGVDYEVGGLLQGQNVAFKVRARDPIADGLTIERTIATKLDTDSTVVVEEWSGIDPERTLDVELRCASRDDRGERRCEMTMGGIAMTVDVDRSGRVRRAVFPIGGIEVVQERVLAHQSD